MAMATFGGMGPNLRTADPGREGVAPGNIVLFDITDPIKDLNATLLKVEELPDMANRLAAAAAIERLIDRALMLRARILNRRYNPVLMGSNAQYTTERIKLLDAQAELRRQSKEERRRQNRIEWANRKKNTLNARPRTRKGNKQEPTDHAGTERDR